MDWVVLDVEADDLEATKLHCLSWQDSNGDSGTCKTYAEMCTFLSDKKRNVLVGHNISRFDVPTLERLLGIDLSGKFLIDTLALGWVLDFDRASYGLESYGVTYGIEKPKIDDWENEDLSVYVDRCEIDVQINTALWKDQLARLQELYDDPDDLVAYLWYITFKMGCARLQEESGWRLDRDQARKELEELIPERDKKVADLSRVMPDVPTWDTRSPPKRMLKGDGEPSELAKKWFDFLEQNGLPRDHGEPVKYIRGYEPPNPNAHGQVKEWLVSLGWKPQTFKYVRDVKSGKMRDIPQVNLPNGGGVCPSVLDLTDDYPDVLVLAGLGVLGHRISILNGFLRDEENGRLRAKIAGLTNTLRFKHAEIVNLPKVEKLYAKGIRSTLLADEGEELCGADMASLEDRIKQHFIYDYDPEYVNELNKPDYDAHLDIACLTHQLSKGRSGISKEDVAWYKVIDRLPDDDKRGLTQDDRNRYKRIKSVRSIFKNGNYACQYGAGPPRLVLTCSIDIGDAKLLHKAYWTKNWAIKEVAKNQTVRRIRVAGVDQMWLLNPVNGFYYSLRTEKDIFSTLVQGTASFVFDLWVREVLKERPQLTAQFHDEIILSIKKGFREQCEDLLNRAIQKTNEILKLNRELAISIQYGNNYAQIH